MSYAYPTQSLSNASPIPLLGYGCGTANYGSPVSKQVQQALEAGYRYIDCAQEYSNSDSVGEGLAAWIKAGKGKREDVYLLTKLGVKGTEFKPRQYMEEQLKMLRVDYVDMVLIHSPVPNRIGPYSLTDAWAEMEKLKAEGLTRGIGVSNYRAEDIEQMSKAWKEAPAINQIEFHPYIAHLPQMQRLLSLCQTHHITIEPYGPTTPLTKAPGGPVDPIVQRLAKKYESTDGQILLRWARQTTRGAVVTTSSKTERMKEQLATFTDEGKDLQQSEVDEIAEAGKGKTARFFQKDVWDNAQP